MLTSLKFAAAFVLLLCIISRSSANPKSDLKVGAILPLSGQFSRIGDLVRGGVVEGVSGKLHLVFEDERCSSVEAVTAFKALSSQGIRLFLGPCCGSPQVAVAPLVRAADAFSLLISSAPRSVIAASGGRMLSVQFSIEDEASFLAKRMFHDGLVESQF